MNYESVLLLQKEGYKDKMLINLCKFLQF